MIALRSTFGAIRHSPSAIVMRSTSVPAAQVVIQEPGKPEWKGWLFSAANGGWEYPAFWTVTLVVQALLGDGAFALRFTGRPLAAQRA